MDTYYRIVLFQIDEDRLRHLLGMGHDSVDVGLRRSLLSCDVDGPTVVLSPRWLPSTAIVCLQTERNL